MAFRQGSDPFRKTGMALDQGIEALSRAAEVGTTEDFAARHPGSVGEVAPWGDERPSGARRFAS